VTSVLSLLTHSCMYGMLGTYMHLTHAMCMYGMLGTYMHE